MNKIFLSIVLFLSVVFSVRAQEKKALKIIKANSTLIDIRNGQEFSNKLWTINPKIKQDIYHTSKLGEAVTFYTDIDSIRVEINENTQVDFIILLNEKDTAYTQIKYRESHLKILKKAKLYSENQDNDLPSFTYLNSENENLKRIRKELKLDSVAGQANEISKLLNLLHWVHETVKHDGSSNNPKFKNAIDLINVCKRENRGVNCRMMATVLNECYLSMGYKSRMVTCMPKPLKFQDCHVINTVFSEQLNKWIWLDPTFDAYVMNEKGELLGIQEVRERLINDKPLILNPTANWNGKKSQTKEAYLYKYMAKNLYRLESPAYSNYNIETTQSGKTNEYIQLLPMDGINQQPRIKVAKSAKSKMVYKTYITNNPKQFWEGK